MAEEVLRGKVEIAGGDQAAQEIGKVTGAEGKLTEQTAAAAPKKAAARKEQEKLNAAEGDYVDILRRVHPALGDVVDGLLKGSKVAGDMATQNIGLTGTWQKATEAIKNNAGALKLLGAGGLVVLGIMAISKAVASMREEFEQATTSIKSHQDALNELKGQEEDTRRSVVAVSDARREGGFTAQEATTATETVADIGAKDRYKFLEQSAVAETAGMFGGRADQAGGGSFDLEQLAGLSFLQQTGRFQADPSMSPEARGREAERALERFAGVIDKAIEKAESVASAGLAAALKETKGTGSTADLEGFIEGKVRPGMDPERIAQIVSALPEAEAEFTPSRQRQRLNFDWQPRDPLSLDVEALLKERGTPLEGHISPEEMAAAQDVQTKLQAATKEDGANDQKEATLTMKEMVALFKAWLQQMAKQGSEPKVEIHNPRYYGARGRATNGQNHAERRGKDWAVTCQRLPYNPHLSTPTSGCRLLRPPGWLASRCGRGGDGRSTKSRLPAKAHVKRWR